MNKVQSFFLFIFILIHLGTLMYFGYMYIYSKFDYVAFGIGTLGGFSYTMILKLKEVKQ
jgi:hypothetical protein